MVHTLEMLVLALSLLIATSSPAMADLPLDSERWLPLLVDGVAISDPADLSGIFDPIELVGTVESPAAYWWMDLSDVYFRVRVARSPFHEDLTSPFDCMPFTCTWAILSDTDGTLTTLDKMLALNDGAASIQVWSGPSGAGWDAGVTVMEHEVIGPSWTGPHLSTADAGSSFDAEDNTFIDISVPRHWLDLTGDAALARIAIVTGHSSPAAGLEADIATTDAGESLSASWSDSIGMDSDGDGLRLDDEWDFGSDPQRFDTDGDGLGDGDEVTLYGTSPTLADTDGDGLSDGDELELHLTDPTLLDSDGDGVSDGDEVSIHGTDPLDGTDPDPAIDIDCDGLPDEIDAEIDTTSDPDGDGLSIDEELSCGSDPCIEELDIDDDGIPNLEEVAFGTDPCDTDDPDPTIDEDCDGIADWEDPDLTPSNEDMDGDGILNIDEAACGGDPCIAEPDIDGDGLTNAEEADLETDPCDSSDPDVSVDEDCDGIPDFMDECIDLDPEDDNDGDGISNGEEVDSCQTDPCTPDEDPDGDGVSNEREVECGTSPCLPDSDADGQWDGDELGPDECGGDEDGDGTNDALDADGPVADSPIVSDDTRYGFSGGEFSGGACSSSGSPATALGCLLGILGVLLRRKPQVLISLVGLTAVLTPTDLKAETINASRFQTTLDTRTFIGLSDAVESNPGWLGSMMLHHASDPLMYRNTDGSQEDIRLLSSLWSTELAGGYNFGRLSVGIQLQVHLYAGGDLDSQTSTVGDLGVGGQMLLVDRRDGPVGISASSRLVVPTGSRALWLRQQTVSGSASLNLSTGQHVVLATNLGLKAIGPAELDGLKVGSSAQWSTGIHLPIIERAWASIEMDGEHYLQSLNSGAAHPVELHGYGRFAVTDQWLLTLGAGTSLSRGVGAPEFSMVAGVSTSPRWKARDRQALTSTPAPAPAPAPVAIPTQALVQISVTDSDGNPLVAEVLLLETDSTAQTNIDGIALLTPDGGQNTLQVSADGYAPVRRSLNLEAGKETSLVLVLAPARVAITADRIVISDKVFFETGSEAILPPSFALLDEVALLLLDHPELGRIEVQGHTDDVGSAAANKALSTARAKSVVDHLVSAGVPADRLSSRGLGESKPLAGGSSEAIRAKNRRVEFHVIERPEN